MKLHTTPTDHLIIAANTSFVTGSIQSSQGCIIKIGKQTSHGKCLCGRIQFNVTGTFGDVRYCHCTQCRSATGTAFSANAKIDSNAWQWVQGQEEIKEFEQLPGIFRGFCSNCGSPIYARLEREPGKLRVRLGSFAGDLPVDITAHVWAEEKASWYHICDELPQHPKSFSDPLSDPNNTG